MNLKKLLNLALIITVSSLLFSCGKNDINQEVANKVAGKWRISSVNGEESPKEDKSYFKFDDCKIADGNCKASFVEPEEGEEDFTESINWSISNQGKTLRMIIVEEDMNDTSDIEIKEISEKVLILYEPTDKLEIELERID